MSSMKVIETSIFFKSKNDCFVNKGENEIFSKNYLP